MRQFHPHWGKMSPQIRRAMTIMVRDHVVHRIGNQWSGKSRQAIHDKTISTMFDRNLAYISSSGRQNAAHRALLTEIGKATAWAILNEGAAPIAEDVSLLVAEIAG